VCDPDAALYRALEGRAVGPWQGSVARLAQGSAAGLRPRSAAGLPAAGLPQESVAASNPARAPRRAGGAVDEDSFERLRVWRMARSEGLPAFRVASNAVLAEIVRTRPANAEQLLAVRGVGPTFCAKHGESLLAELHRLRPAAGR
jgi:superfamily II DNA helicase RecQ